MKKYIIIVVTVLFSFSSCNDFLDLQPGYLLNEGIFFKTTEDFNTALVGAYASLSSFHDSYPGLFLGELTTDNAHITWTSPTQSERELDEWEVTSTNDFIGSAWNTGFRTISNCNNIIYKLEQVELPAMEETRIKGEAQFLRAYWYFYMVRLFGDIPIIEQSFRSPLEIQDFEMIRAPVSDVYEFIISDLISTEELLQQAGLVNQSDKGKASVGAAKTLLGKVYLTNKLYALAAAKLKEVIDMNMYSLQPDYKTLFTNGNDDLPESVFEVKYMSGNVGLGNSYASSLTPPRFDMAIFPNNMQGSGRCVPTQDIVDSYEPGDLRRNVSIGDSVLLQDGTYEEETYGLKMVDFTVGLAGDGGINYPALRYADVLLMYAEALNETDQTPQAHTYINMVRNRVDLPDLEGLSKTEMFFALERERRVEFLSEAHRWYDLVRTGRALTVINNYYISIGMSHRIEEHNLVMPIPQREIDVDPTLPQNPEY